MSPGFHHHAAHQEGGGGPGHQLSVCLEKRFSDRNGFLELPELPGLVSVFISQASEKAYCHYYADCYYTTINECGQRILDLESNKHCITASLAHHILRRRNRCTCTYRNTLLAKLRRLCPSASRPIIPYPGACFHIADIGKSTLALCIMHYHADYTYTYYHQQCGPERTSARRKRKRLAPSLICLNSSRSVRTT